MVKRIEKHSGSPDRKRALVALALSFTAAAGALVLAPSAAQAETTGDHCVYNLTRDELTCSETPEAALAADAADAGDVGIQATSTLVRLYDQVDYGTANGTFTLTVDGTYNCTAAYTPVEFTVVNLSSAGWSNRASSARTYHQCDVKLFDSADATGTSSTWIDALANLNTASGGWSNRASSFQVS
ncbi:hypothetical protein [Glycomyces tritici]|uniref:C1q domain-containing protein n=1 Tax=Glycomyces tritici TaxID=2665176 RepID=A0ABT7YYP5_9ACTN|nr:hypothetical protein [Glycomyces tritici]MDN3243366.1 hypothetical protein [Glycomyces tritici]MDN3243757.1 hypothetical protein [Glycomyces tritici]